MTPEDSSADGLGPMLPVAHGAIKVVEALGDGAFQEEVGSLEAWPLKRHWCLGQFPHSVSQLPQLVAQHGRTMLYCGVTFVETSSKTESNIEDTAMQQPRSMGERIRTL